MKKEQILVAMSHALQGKQISALNELGFEVSISETYVAEKCNMLSPYLTSKEVREIAHKIINEAIENGCTGIAMTGEPMLTFHVWDIARASELEVLQSTTERKTVEVKQPDGSMLKTQIFDYVQWRAL